MAKNDCPGCAKGEEPVLLDEHGTLASISGLPGRLGHDVDDFWWYCDQYPFSGGPAFPGHFRRSTGSGTVLESSEGMTRRQWYAGLVIAELVGAYASVERRTDMVLVCRKAWAWADALLATESEE